MGWGAKKPTLRPRKGTAPATAARPPHLGEPAPWRYSGPGTMPKHKKERRHPRFATQRVPGRIAFSVDAQALNISLSGIGVRTSTQLHVGRRYGFRLGQEPHAILVSGSVVWCRLAQTDHRPGGDVAPVYHAGIAFSDVIGEKTMRLFEFIEQSETPDLRRRIFGRLKVAKDHSIVLESKSEFLVRQISLSGMLIESPLALHTGSVFGMEILLAGHRFSAGGRIVNSGQVGLLGVEFLELSGGQQEILEDFIREELEQEE